MKSLLLLALTAELAFSCIPGYETYYGGICITTKSRGEWCIADNFDDEMHNCEADSTRLLEIKSQQNENDIIDLVNSHYGGTAPYLGLDCANGHFVWRDGTALTYKNPSLDNSCSGATRLILNPKSRKWEGINILYSCMAICQDRIDNDAYCGDFLPINAQGSDMCYKIVTGSNVPNNGRTDQANAQFYCQNMMSNLISIHSEEENTFMRRTAVGYKWSDFYIGINQVSSNGNFTWIDGSRTTYSNFAKGNPDLDVGRCVKMDSATGQWRSAPCGAEDNFICGRVEEDKIPVAPTDCTTYPTLREGQHIYSPGYPKRGEIPCGWNIVVASGMKAQIEFVFFESNRDKGYLTIDGYNFSTRITGSNHAGEIYTSGDNEMRLYYYAEPGANVRGFHAIVKAVPN